MIDHGQLRVLFDALVELPLDAQLVKLADLRVENEALAQALSELLEIERTEARVVTKASRAAIANALSKVDSEALLGRQVDRFTLIAEIGRGGMGVVFKAVRVDGDIQQFVALKMLQRGFADEKAIERFLRERKFLASLDHPNICRFLDSGMASPGSPYVVMELLDGQDLLSYAKNERLNIEQRIRLFQKVLQGVAFAHRNLVIHRDLKPTNIMVDQHGTPKLLDFGIAHSAEVTEQTDSEHWFSAHYSAPEQLLARHLSTSSDIYSLGVVLYELLASRPAFQGQGQSAAEIERQILEMDAPAMHLGARNGDRFWPNDRLNELDFITQKAMRKDPNERYVSVNEFSEDLEAWLNCMPIRACGKRTGYRVKKFLQRNRVLVVAGILASTLLLLAVVQIVVQGAVATQQRNRAELALSILTDAFTAADPLQSSKGEMSVRTVLRQSSDRLLVLDGEHAQDLIPIGLRIAGLQMRLGLTQDGKLLASSAFEQAQKLGDEVSRVQLHRLLIRAEVTLGEMEKAKRMLLAETNPEARLHPEFLLLQADTFNYVASQYAEKQHWLERSVQAFDAMLDHPAAITANLRLAEVHFRAGRAQRALHITEQTLKKFTAAFGAAHSSVLRAQFYQLNLQERLGNAPLVVADGPALLQRIERTFGEDSTILGATHSLLAHAYHTLKQPSAAVAHSRAVYQNYARAMGALHESTLRELVNLAITLKQIPSARDEALASYKRLLQDALASPIIEARFRHYAIASAALYFRDIGEHQLALEAIAHSSYRPDLAQWGAAERADYANDVRLIASDAGCARAEYAPEKQLCYEGARPQCLLAVKRYCALTAGP